MASVTYLTEQGLEALKARYHYLVSEARPRNRSEIGRARELGDLSENAEYDSAKEEQAVIEAEIAEIEEKLRNHEIIEAQGDKNRVSLGCTVKIFDEQYKEELIYQIVGSSESNPAKGLISNESPVGRALLGAKVGTTVEVSTPAGELKYKIVQIKN